MVNILTFLQQYVPVIELTTTAIIPETEDNMEVKVETMQKFSWVGNN